ncbi:hypothetical protein FCS83_07940 [Oenococcus sp. UCMA 17063]|nr:hypothetical protein [Oenococcus sp. UCMA 17063]
MKGNTKMLITKRKEITEEERKLGYSKYFDLPLYSLGAREEELLDLACPFDSSKAIKAQNWLDLLKANEYSEPEWGYTMMPDGTGYIAVYTVYPNATPTMLAWYFRWLNVHSKGMPKNHGNLKYKIWNPADHYDHGFINKKDKWDGIYTVESLDLGEGEPPTYTIRNAIDPKVLRDYGFTEEREKALKEAGCFVDCAVESFHTLTPDHTRLPGSHLCLTLSRACPQGGMEKCSREWIGYGIKNGKVVKDETTPDFMLSEKYLKKVITHSTIEAQQLAKFLPDLYNEYHEFPDDAD